MVALPKETDFPLDTEFIIKDFDAPLFCGPVDGCCEWFNWHGGKSRPYAVENPKTDNNWPASSFSEWVVLIQAPIEK
ncbi:MULTISPECIES: hypothetical protein [unclassified Pseudomonas]|uniref:hypothetical protein n=1 Tax=unclassified Pseudomonas TaxID=196821 RepID=UPI00244C889A|nr:MULTISPECIES: hypothetical protein [unclassified Pseudomonas]MDH0893408.1 hypothetical protein [Pseudomonas sp. GD03875]MDH1066252.1 hypothetical protein [Pseudomonas sp. GD03985]